MNRREFSMTVAGLGAFSVLPGSLGRLSAAPGGATTPFYVRGLAMLSLADPNHLRIALPRAPHHSASLSFVPAGGEPVSTAIHGHGRLIGAAGAGRKPDTRVPALVHMKELYPRASARIEASPTIITIPWPAVAAISADTLSDERWTFVEKATGEEVVTFRPRRLAESVRFDLVSTGILEVGHTTVDLREVDEVSTDFVPTRHDTGDYTDHFHYYMPYLELEAGAPELEPREVLRRVRTPTFAPTGGNAFAAARLWPYNVCFPFAV